MSVGRAAARACQPLAWTAALTLGTASGAQAMSAEQVYASVAPSVWRVTTYDADNLPLGQGSGVVIGTDAIITNCHVLAKGKRIAVRHENKPAIDARLVMWDVKRDLCQLEAKGLGAPAVAIADSSKVAVGQGVFAIGNPKGLDLTMSAGLVSSLRRNESGQLVLIQTSAAISRGSSGGGLFDAEARLIGLTTIGSVTGDAQNLNFAIPSDWIRELPQRHAAAAASTSASATTAAAAPVLPSTPGGEVQPNIAGLRRGDQIVYKVTDLLTGLSRDAVYTVDRLEAERVVFNQGGRVEHKDGSVISIRTPIAGEMDNCAPPGGWQRKDMAPGDSWAIESTRPDGSPCAGLLRLQATVTGEETMPTPIGDVPVLHIEYEGTLLSKRGHVPFTLRIKASAWYARPLGRPVRFEFAAVSSGGGAYPWREMAELTAIVRH